MPIFVVEILKDILRYDPRGNFIKEQVLLLSTLSLELTVT